MPRNIEIKARIDSVAALQRKAAALADQGPTVIVQDDTFFACPNGRLKLRVVEIEPGKHAGELIFYRRADQQGPKPSFYVLAPTDAPDSLREALTHAYGQAGRVCKRRTLFLIGRTRIHLDQVDDLGEFLELEVVLADDEAPEQGIAEAQQLMAQLGVMPSQLIEGAYVDLMAAGVDHTPTVP